MTEYEGYCARQGRRELSTLHQMPPSPLVLCQEQSIREGQA